ASFRSSQKFPWVRAFGFFNAAGREQSDYSNLRARFKFLKKYGDSRLSARDFTAPRKTCLKQILPL
ncbi:MAG: hypothetical protein LBR71_00370, partial [Synergistaceae bacterium]|nr:hypothetical protein [Synergistaceae bacterium]